MFSTGVPSRLHRRSELISPERGWGTLHTIFSLNTSQFSASVSLGVGSCDILYSSIVVSPGQPSGIVRTDRTVMHIEFG
jgi:hypothetical protein